MPSETARRSWNPARTAAAPSFICCCVTIQKACSKHKSRLAHGPQRHRRASNQSAAKGLQLKKSIKRKALLLPKTWQLKLPMQPQSSVIGEKSKAKALYQTDSQKLASHAAMIDNKSHRTYIFLKRNNTPQPRKRFDSCFIYQSHFISISSCRIPRSPGFNPASAAPYHPYHL